MSPGESFASGSIPTLVKDFARHRWLALLVLASFLFYVAAVVIRIGIEATPYETTDSAGRPMGFNDPLSAEHYWIIVQHFRPAELLKPERAYEWLLLAMQGTGAALLLSRSGISVRLMRWFFAAQVVIFPLGLLLCWMPPIFLFFSLTSGGLDRECYTDFPFVASMAMIAHSTWVLSSLIIAYALRGPGLSLSRVWRAFADALR